MLYGLLHCMIIGPDGREIHPRIHDNGNGNFLVDWTPRIPGDYKIDVKYRDQPIPGSVFTAKAWDASTVIVSNIRPGRIGKPNYFNGKRGEREREGEEGRRERERQTDRQREREREEWRDGGMEKLVEGEGRDGAQ